MDPERQRTVTVRFEPDTYHRLRVASARAGLSMNAWIESLCDTASKASAARAVTSGALSLGIEAGSVIQEAQEHEHELVAFVRRLAPLPTDADDGGTT